MLDHVLTLQQAIIGVDFPSVVSAGLETTRVGVKNAKKTGITRLHLAIEGSDGKVWLDAVVLLQECGIVRIDDQDSQRISPQAPSRYIEFGTEGGKYPADIIANLIMARQYTGRGS